jgi:hypothetical protein
LSSFYENGRTCPQVIFAALRTGFYSCSRHIRYVRTPPLHLSVALEEQG